MVEETLHKGNNKYQGEWTQSIAVGGKTFFEEIKEKFGVLAKGRKTIEQSGTLYLREPTGSYNAVLRYQNGRYWAAKHLLLGY